MNSLFRNNSVFNSRLPFKTFLAMLVLFLSIAAVAQQPQLTLADLLIGLRSKKVSLDERNAILAQAVAQRGITFTLTPEIEKELGTTGASAVLLDAVRQKSPAVPKPTPSPTAVAAVTPVPTPTPPAFTFDRTRADSNHGNGEDVLAVADYDKAVTLKADSAIAFLNRGRAHLNLNDYNSARADFEKSIELDPKESKAYYNRGLLSERVNTLDSAAADYQKAVDLDPSNQEAVAGLKRVRGLLQAKSAQQPTSPPPAVVKPDVPATAPESVNLGSLTSANAVRMVQPIYSPIAQRARIEGRVVVEVELDLQGNVVSAKAVSGHQFLRGAAEEAARKSKFKPAMFSSQALKATASITYNFSLTK